jgi:hypothetical protein
MRTRFIFASAGHRRQESLHLLTLLIEPEIP